MEIAITEHAYERMNERCKLKKTAVRKMAHRATERGITQKDSTGRLEKFINNKLNIVPRPNTRIFIYGEYVYIFQEDNPELFTLITVYEIPQDLKTVAIARQKKKRG